MARTQYHAPNVPDTDPDPDQPAPEQHDRVRIPTVHLPSVDLNRIVPKRPPGPILEITFLGTSAASSIANHPTSSMLLRFGDERILVDAGARSLTQLRRAGVDPATLTAIVITHWHTDHVAGLPTLLAAAAAPTLGRTTPLRVYAPKPPGGMIATLGVASRRLDAVLVETVGGDVIPVSGASLTAITSDHVMPSLAYAFAEAGDGGRRVVFSGDTRPNLDIMQAAGGADLLIHEATFAAARNVWAHRTGHSTAPQTAMIAKAAGVGALALTHISARDQRADILSEARVLFPSAVMPDDLEVIEVFSSHRLPGATPQKRRPGWAHLGHRALTPLDIPEIDGLAS